MWICLWNKCDIIPSAPQFTAKLQRERQLWNNYLMEPNRILVDDSCLSSQIVVCRDRTQRGHLKPYAYLEIKWNCEGHFVDALTVSPGGYSSPTWTKLVETVYFHSPPYSTSCSCSWLFEDHENCGAGEFRVSWEVEMVRVIKALSIVQASLKCQSYIYISSSMQACVFMVLFFTPYIPVDSVSIVSMNIF